MTRHDLLVLDTIETSEYMSGELSDDVLPSQVHPSYPYGNPTHIKHPSSKPRPGYDPTSRALFEDMGYSGGGVNGSLRWRDLGLDDLLPVDESKEEARRAIQARKMASGSSNQNPPGQQQAYPTQGQLDASNDEDLEEEEEDENDENNNDTMEEIEEVEEEEEPEEDEAEIEEESEGDDE
ncbi:hypothetical protein JR316_0008298 [Psilocybe cubensis]|uniref:Uncharacterized protein n=2 Tax=Psilocybe cubensis TaxID=181762 RepID=A0ACB8GVD6_PSICU|nr:hypothetical protein JR316_0008298 [Psilocybe cubensis]KAH9479703.1 hypothetical protein JR316_0008298 [Psilocybe cubensis]